MDDAVLQLIVTGGLGLVSGGGLVSIGKLVYDIKTGRAATQRRNNRDALRDIDLERELRYAFQSRAAQLEVLAIAAGVPADKIPPPVDTSRLFRSDP